MVRFINRILLLALLSLDLFNNNICLSQIKLKDDKSRENIFIVRIKQFNEFIDRFNYKTQINGDPIDSVFKSKIPREKMVNSLFDLKDPRIDPSNPEYSKTYTSEKAEFVKLVADKKLKIYKYSEKIVAEAKSRVFYKGIPNTVQIFLKQEIVDNDKVKWVIFDVKGSIFNFLKSDSIYIRFISPSSNETDFVNLRRALEDKDYLQYYASKDYKPDYLILFFYLVNSELIKFDYVEEVKYTITDIAGWNITVKEFNRTEMNSGWLISDISKTSLLNSL